MAIGVLLTQNANLDPGLERERPLHQEKIFHSGNCPSSRTVEIAHRVALSELEIKIKHRLEDRFPEF